MFRTLAITASAFASVVSAKDVWAVLIAGSNGYSNYRHQADVCHAYKTLIKRGVKPEHVITMMVDDVANSQHNPFKGKLYNYPWKTMDEAIDVYEGCRIDYSGRDVTPDKFTAVLTGDKNTAGGRVLQSGEDDHVFVNFVDHGAVGLIGFPQGTGVLHAKDLNQALKDMYANKMFNQLVFYLEACESGSMFEGLLPDDLPIYALTASNAHESSWGTYCGQDAQVGGTNVGSCLGDLFSVKWMEDTDKHTNSKETLLEQFTKVKNDTDKSHVMQYGQFKKIQDEDISEFEGGESSANAMAATLEGSASTKVSSRDIAVDQLFRDYMATGSAEAAADLIDEIKAREDAKALGEKISVHALGWSVFESPVQVSWTPELLDCHADAVRHFGQTCGWTEHRYVVSKTLYGICSESGSDTALIKTALNSVCPEPELFA